MMLMNVVKVTGTMNNRMNQDNLFLRIVKKTCIARGPNSNMIMNGRIGTNIKYSLLLTNDRQPTLIIIATSVDQDRVHSLNTKNNNIRVEGALKTNLQ
jgi:hypothetical protein